MDQESSISSKSSFDHLSDSRTSVELKVNATMASKTVKVAAIQAEPVWNDLQGGVEKPVKLIREAAQNGANVIGFPEVFIPGYPWYVFDKYTTTVLHSSERN